MKRIILVIISFFILILDFEIPFAQTEVYVKMPVGESDLWTLQLPIFPLRKKGSPQTRRAGLFKSLR